MENLTNTKDALAKFSQNCIGVLDRLVPWKTNAIDGTSAFFDKHLTQALMRRSHQWKRLLYMKSTYSIKSSQLLFISFDKTCKLFYTYLSEKDDSDNKKLWKTVKPLLSYNEK